MVYDLNKIEQQYQIKLDDTQKDVLSSLIDFVESDEHEICLVGSAGSSKSFIASIFYDILEANNYSVTFVAPTNKAKLVITDKGNRDRNSLTIHSLLSLRPNLDILEFDASQLQFNFGFNVNQEVYDVLIIDECSMINDELYDTLKSKFLKTKLLFLGDSAQLAPVKQRNKAKPFQGKTIKLTKVYRQKNNDLYDLLEYLRNKPIYDFKKYTSDSIIIYDNIKEMLNNHVGLFKIAGDFDDQSLVKMVTYTNKRIDALNTYIRSKLYPNAKEYNEREILTGYDTCDYFDKHIENSRDYMVVRCIASSVEGLPAYLLTLESNGSRFDVKILSRNCTQEEFNRLAEKCENLRIKAVKSKNKADWRKFYKVYNSFLTPVDLLYDGRVIKRKSLDYGYCISTHKSQSSGYQIVMIDMENLFRCPNKEELRQLQYVACSRTTSNLIIYQK